MTPSSLDFLSQEAIGIIGCGHLGRAIALELVSHGFSSDRLRLSLSLWQKQEVSAKYC